MEKRQLPAYIVELWGSKPHTNDDCWAGYHFVTKTQAREAMEEVIRQLNAGQRVWGACSNRNTEYVVLDGPGVHEEHIIGSFQPQEDTGDADWQREQAMQAGMGLGIDAYNDTYGW